jgi:4-carboxymuconolactone decarboxylase
MQNDAPRLGKLAPVDLTDEQRALWASIADGPRAAGPFRLTDAAGALEGPFNAMLLAPELGTALQELGRQLRYGGALTDRAREIAILIVARHWHSEFETYAHEAVARTVGLSPDEVNAVRALRLADFIDPYENLIALTTQALVASADLADDQYAAAVDELGVEVVFELTTLVGYYATLALQLRVFRVGLPE